MEDGLANFMSLTGLDAGAAKGLLEVRHGKAASMAVPYTPGWRRPSHTQLPLLIILCNITTGHADLSLMKVATRPVDRNVCINLHARLYTAVCCTCTKVAW